MISCWIIFSVDPKTLFLLAAIPFHVGLGVSPIPSSRAKVLSIEAAITISKASDVTRPGSNHDLRIQERAIQLAGHQPEIELCMPNREVYYEAFSTG